MKPKVGELVFCSGKYCMIIFGFNVTFALVTILLNISIITALKRIAKKTSWKVPSIILCSMACIDLLTGFLCQPLHGYFVFRNKNVYEEAALSRLEAWLFFALNYSSYTLCCASLLIAGFMAIERLMAIAYTFKHRSNSTPKRSVTVILCLIAFSMVVPLFRFIAKETKIVFMVLLALVVIASLVTIIVAYLMLFRSLKKQQIKAKSLSASDKGKMRRLKQERRLARSFALLTIILFAMYFPQLMLKPISIVIDVKKGSKLSELLVILEDSFNTFLYCNSAVNPFIYYARHEEVKKEIQNLFCCCFKTKSTDSSKSMTCSSEFNKVDNKICTTSF